MPVGSAMVLLFPSLSVWNSPRVHVWRSGHQNAVSPSIAFHAWHLGRWADRVQSTVPGLTPALAGALGAGAEIWEREGLADAWGFDRSKLGNGRTGSGMTDADAQALPFPATEGLLEYVDRAFGAIDDEQLVSPGKLKTAHGPIHGRHHDEPSGARLAPPGHDRGADRRAGRPRHRHDVAGRCGGCGPLERVCHDPASVEAPVEDDDVRIGESGRATRSGRNRGRWA